MTDNVAVITGASSGIGQATALKLASKGYNLVLAGRRDQLLEDVARQCEKYGVETLSVQVDVTKEAEVQALADATIEQFGHFDIWINAAGVIFASRFLDQPSAEFRGIIETNLFGTT